MSEPFLAEVKLFGFNFAPRGYALCDGQILPINQNQSLYSLLGTTYGGDGRTTFGLPELRGRTPVHEGTGFSLGQKGGEENHTLTTAEMPTHRHNLRANTNAVTTSDPDGTYLGNNPGQPYGTTSNGTMGTEQINNTSGSQSHNNMQPYQVINFCIALQGLFPSRN